MHTAPPAPTSSATTRSSSRAATTTGPGAGDRLSISRRLRRSAGLPSGRAVAGALLVMLSVLGIVAVAQSASRQELDTWIVIAAPIAAGERIRPEHLATAQMDLIDETARRAITDPDDVLGATALIPLDVGDLVLSAAVAPAGADPDVTGRSLGLSITSDQALGGQVAVGDRVDVVALGTDEIEPTVLVRGALVTSRSGGGDESIGSSGELTLTLAVADEVDALAVIGAHTTSGITLLRASSLELGSAE